MHKKYDTDNDQREDHQTCRPMGFAMFKTAKKSKRDNEYLRNGRDECKRKYSSRERDIGSRGVCVNRSNDPVENKAHRQTYREVGKESDVKRCEGERVAEHRKNDEKEKAKECLIEKDAGAYLNILNNTVGKFHSIR
jgi:hypothetical protein